ncbi:rhomboid family intramembrane serine protease [Puniceibacterium confluentis]|uniref:rhomboid family intramembrane serine protease n=1 Tax=Puniceibacterium confluentis TaxID=1958944 RepID=UPI0011B3C8B8|nr:rhomboid family intramembrane serine protease [Puniceibacterium confluentis]
MSAPAPPPPRHPSRWLPWPPALLVLLLASLLPGLVLLLADLGLAGPPYLRLLAYRLGAFQPDLLTGAAQPVFAAQPVLMFLSYGVLHTGPVHLAGNLAALLYLGRLTLERRPAAGLWAIYLLASLGAAGMFALAGPPHATMAGASGALFGLLGAWCVDSGLLGPQGPKAAPRPLAQLLRLLACAGALILFDIGGRFLIGTPVAWQAHTGGFLSGAVLALLRPAPVARRG